MTTIAQTTNRTIALDDSQHMRCEVQTRMTGYHRPVSSFNIGKQGEFHECRSFIEGRAR